MTGSAERSPQGAFEGFGEEGCLLQRQRKGCNISLEHSALIKEQRVLCVALKD